MKILIATGIFKPELGGPATVALELAKRLKATGHSVTVITYSNQPTYSFDEDLAFPIIRIVRRRNKISNYYRYYRAVSKAMPEHDITYTLDWFSAGVPIWLASRSTHIPYIVRVGGGYIWEKYLAENKPPLTLKEFYARGLHKKYRLFFWLIQKVLQNAQRVVFNSDEQRKLYQNIYNLKPENVLTIYNAIPENRLSGLVNSYNTSHHERDKEIVFAGRLIKMKNIESLIRAFAKLKDQTFRLLIMGDGPLENELKQLVRDLRLEKRVDFIPAMSQSDLYKRIVNSYLVVIPSWTDISPHQAYECLALGIPFLLTKENYLSINNQHFLKIDPHSVDDIADKMNMLLDPEAYKKFVDELHRITFDHPWSDVVSEHLKLFVSVTHNHHDRS